MAVGRYVQQDRDVGFHRLALCTNSEEPAQSQTRLSHALSKAWSTLCVLHRVATGLWRCSGMCSRIMVLVFIATFYLLTVRNCTESGPRPRALSNAWSAFHGAGTRSMAFSMYGDRAWRSTLRRELTPRDIKEKREDRDPRPLPEVPQDAMNFEEHQMTELQLAAKLRSVST